MNLKGSRVAMLGWGVSGRAAARLLLARGALVEVCSDTAEEPEEGITFTTSPERGPARDFELAVVSPGIPFDHPWLEALRARRIPCLSELEFGWMHLSGKTLAITGSLGKTSTAMFCRDALKTAGFSVSLCGNIGNPVCAVAADGPDLDWNVIEVSSFQLETVHRFHPDIAIITNIVPNHLDRHGDLDAYRALKFRVFKRMHEENTLVVPEDLREDLPQGIRPVLRIFGGGDADASWEPGMLKTTGAEIPISGGWFDNPVYGNNAAAAVLALREAEVTDRFMNSAMKAFKGPPHRMEKAGSAGGITFVDDSKSTCMAALAAGVRMSGGPVHLIAGGKLKEMYFQAIPEVINQYIRRIYLIGESAETLYQSWSGRVCCQICGTLETAVRHAVEAAEKDEWIVLSPGCASFDQFASYGSPWRTICGDRSAGLCTGF